MCFLPIFSGHQVRWTYQPGSHRRKVTQEFSSTFSSAVRALIFLARRIEPLLSLVDREVEFCVVVVVLTLKTVLTPLTSIQYPSLSYSSTQGKETNFRGHKLTQNKVQKNNDKNKKDPEKVPTLVRKI